MTATECSTISSMTPGRQYLLPYFVGPHLPADSQVPVHGQGPQRKVLAIQMIAKIQHPRESGARKMDLFPRTILHLVTEQILDTASDAEGIGHPG
jgi:hypothetical protein